MNIPFIDELLNQLSMYRVVLYYLCALLAGALVATIFHVLAFSPLALLFSTAFLLSVCWATNTALSRILKAPTGVESVYITALILALIITPVLPTNLAGVGFLLFVGVVSMASKYILAFHKQHLLNPAAVAVLASGYAISQWASWWVGGNLYLLPIVLVGGLLMVRKIQRADLMLSFFVVTLLAAGATTTGHSFFTPIWQTLVHSSIFFFAFVMLTEPATTPATRSQRIMYGALVGLLFAPNIHIGSIYTTPEMALVLGNIFSYAVSPKKRFVLTLTKRESISKDVHEFVFTSDKPLTFAPGQYLEWTLPHKKSDSRGNRRYFTIASSPTEQEVRLGAKFYPKPSTFKQALEAMPLGSTLSAGQLAGDFTLPRDRTRKLVFIAGGIGITPFRSMVQYLIDKQERRDVVLLYSARSKDEFAYKDVFDHASKELGIKTIYEPATLSAERITQDVPDYADRTYYISGPRGMVVAFEKALGELGIKPWHIKTDFFPGLT